MKKGYRAHGRGRVKRPDAKRNATPKAVIVRHGGKSAILAARINKNTREWRFIAEHAGALAQQMGGPDAVTTTMLEIIDQCARLRLLERIAFAEALRSGVMKNGAVSPAFAAFLQAVARRASLLQVLGA